MRFLCLLILIACAGPAIAGGSERSALGPALDSLKHFSGPTMTGALLRRCVTLDSELRELEGRVNQGAQNLDAAEATFKRLGEGLDRDKVSLDHSDGDAVDRYNARANRHAALINDYNARLPAHTALVQQNNGLVDEFNRACSGHAYIKQEWIEASARLGR